MLFKQIIPFFTISTGLASYFMNILSHFFYQTFKFCWQFFLEVVSTQIRAYPLGKHFFSASK